MKLVRPIDTEDDDIEIVPIPMGAATRERLDRLSRFMGKPPLKVAESLFHDLLLDDEFFNDCSPPSGQVH